MPGHLSLCKLKETRSLLSCFKNLCLFLYIFSMTEFDQILSAFCSQENYIFIYFIYLERHLDKMVHVFFFCFTFNTSHLIEYRGNCSTGLSNVQRKLQRAGVYVTLTLDRASLSPRQNWKYSADFSQRMTSAYWKIYFL